MTQNLQYQAHDILPFPTRQEKANVRNRRQTQLRNNADAMLHEMAFVLKMTQRVRDQIETEADAKEPVTV